MNRYILYHGDCLDVMSVFKDKEFDLCLTDPPYGFNTGGWKEDLGVSPQLEYPKMDWDNKPLSKEQLDEMIRVSKNQIIFGGNHFSDILPVSRGWMVWDKLKMSPPTNFADVELIWTSFDTLARVFYHRWRGFIRDTEMGTKRLHPTQKPVKLIEWLIEKFSEKEDTILDPFMGSGTTLFAAQNKGRNCVGVELSPHYCDVIKTRCFHRSFLDRSTTYDFRSSFSTVNAIQNDMG